MKFSDAINKAIADAMKADNQVLCLGLGATDPKGVFGTTLGLEDSFGCERVFDIPTSENGITGVCIGLAMAGFRPILTHQRLDFALLSLDQIINNAAKLHYMFGGEVKCPMVIRMIVGRGWGQGPTHSQNLQMLFSGIPGLRVAIPGNTQDAYSQLRAAIDCNDPVIFLEHRWLHNSANEIDFIYSKEDILKQKRLREGSDYTILTCSYMIPEAIRARKIIQENFNIIGSIINFRNYHIGLLDEVKKEVKTSKKLLIIDTSQSCFTIAHHIAYEIKQSISIENVKIISMPNVPEPTSHYLTRDFYNGAQEIVTSIGDMCSIERGKTREIIKNMSHQVWHDVPGDWFKGPF